MASMLAGTPTPDQIADMNAEMEVLKRILQQLMVVAHAQEPVAATPPAATPVPTMAMPGMQATATLTPTATVSDTGSMGGMDMSAMGGTPEPAFAATATVTHSMAPIVEAEGSGASGASDALMTQILTLSKLLHDAVLTMQGIMAGGPPSAEELDAMQAKLDELQFMMRDVMAQMQISHVQAASTPPAAAVANAAASASGMMGDMMGDDMMAMMDSMMGSGAQSGSSMAAMPSATPDANAAPADTSLERKAEAGGVTVTVLPLNLDAAAGSTIDFQVKLETHTVDLNQDLTVLSVLAAPSGTELGSPTWVGPTGGHHIQGTLSFPATDTTGAAVTLIGPGTLALTIRDLAGIAERTFTWELPQ
jgi:hypothetical protein